MDGLGGSRSLYIRIFSQNGGWAVSSNIIAHSQLSPGKIGFIWFWAEDHSQCIMYVPFENRRNDIFRSIFGILPHHLTFHIIDLTIAFELMDYYKWPRKALCSVNVYPGELPQYHHEIALLHRVVGVDLCITAQKKEVHLIEQLFSWIPQGIPKENIRVEIID